MYVHHTMKTVPFQGTDSSTPSAKRYTTRIPIKLIHQSAIGLHAGIYALVGRLWMLGYDSVPLSVRDIHRFSPQTPISSIRRSLAWLCESGWLIASVDRGNKTMYTPTWGVVNQIPLPWARNHPNRGRPRHIRAISLDVRVLDVYIGRIVPRPEQDAPNITRYVSTPVLTLRDVGVLAHITAGMMVPEDDAAALRRYQLITASNRPRTLADDDALLAVISQQGLFDTTRPTITEAGLQRAGFVAADAAEPSASVFFVEPGLAHMYIPTDAHTCAHETGAEKPADTAAECGKTDHPAQQECILQDDHERQEYCISTTSGGTQHQRTMRDQHTRTVQKSASPHQQQDEHPDRHTLLAGAGVQNMHLIRYYVNDKNVPLDIIQSIITAVQELGKGAGYIIWMLRYYCETGGLPHVYGHRNGNQEAIDWSEQARIHGPPAGLPGEREDAHHTVLSADPDEDALESAHLLTMVRMALPRQMHPLLASARVCVDQSTQTLDLVMRDATAYRLLIPDQWRITSFATSYGFSRCRVRMEDA